MTNKTSTTIDVSNIEVFTQNSIRISKKTAPACIIYFDTYEMKNKPHDADYLFITHDHYDHYSPEDAARVMNENTIVVVPDSLYVKAQELNAKQLIGIRPDESIDFGFFSVETVPAYNVEPERLDCHPRENNWVGYILLMDGLRYYISGDTDQNPDNEQVKCDVALIPVGGTYTCDFKQAAAWINQLRPRVVIPTHYGTLAGEKEDGDRFATLVDPAIQVVKKLAY